MTDAEREAAFLREYVELCNKYHSWVVSCSCCGTWVEDAGDMVFTADNVVK